LTIGIAYDGDGPKAGCRRQQFLGPAFLLLCQLPKNIDFLGKIEPIDLFSSLPGKPNWKIPL
jgi:hypothetical protein